MPNSKIYFGKIGRVALLHLMQSENCMKIVDIFNSEKRYRLYNKRIITFIYVLHCKVDTNSIIIIIHNNVRICQNHSVTME